MMNSNDRGSGGETGGPTATASAASKSGAFVNHEPAGTGPEKKRSAAAAAAQQSCLDGGAFDERLKKKLASAAGTGGAAAESEIKPGAFAVDEPAGTASKEKKAAAATAVWHYSHDGGTLDERLKKKSASAAETGGGAAASTGLKPGVFAVNEPAGTASKEKKAAAAAAARHYSHDGGTFDERSKKKLASDAETDGGAGASTGLKPGVFAVNEPAGTASEKKKAAAAAAARHYSHDGGTLDERLTKKLASSADSITMESIEADVKRMSIVLVSNEECAAVEKEGDRDTQGNSGAAGVTEPGSTLEDENIQKSMPLDVESGQHEAGPVAGSYLAAERGAGRPRSPSPAPSGDGGEIQRAPEGQGSRSGERPSLLGRVGSTLYAHVSATGEYLISATLVEEDDGGEVVVAERVGFFERRGKVIALALCVIVVAVILIAVRAFSLKEEAVVPLQRSVPSMLPSMLPSSSPSFDPRPTLEIVQERGHVRCGVLFLGNLMCRAIASVIIGDSDAFEPTILFEDHVNVGFQQLHERSVDILLDSEQTVANEFRERTTGSGFTFSSPYFYTGTAYIGNKTLVECAQKTKRHDECSSLVVCFYFGDDPREGLFNLLKTSFPSKHWMAMDNSGGIDEEEFMNSTCNVFAGNRLGLVGEQKDPNSTRSRWASNKNFDLFLGDVVITSVSSGMVTRKDDREFSDIINWVLQAHFYGEEQGLTRNSSLCQKYTSLPMHASELNFMNAVHCVDNYRQILDEASELFSFNPSVQNEINNGTTGMLYATPFGYLDNEKGANIDVAPLGLNDITNKERLNCGVVVPVGFDGDIASSDKVVGMSVDYCRALAAALFGGSLDSVNLTAFSQDDGFVELNEGTIDVLAGGKVEKKYDFKNPSLQVGGFDFSLPYYYGNETARDDLSIFALATREDDATFSSFVNCVVWATIYAEKEGIVKEQSNRMPLLPWFGREFEWALKDVIHSSGSYGQIYENHFGYVAKEDRGRNQLDKNSPLQHSTPGLPHEHGIKNSK